MLRSARWRNRLGGGLLAFLGVSAIGLAAFFAWHESRVRPVQLRMTAGQQKGTRHRIAQELRREASRRGISIALREMSGSGDALPRSKPGRSTSPWSRAAWR